MGSSTSKPLPGDVMPISSSSSSPHAIPASMADSSSNAPPSQTPAATASTHDVDPYAALTPSAGKENAEILRAYANTLSATDAAEAMNNAQYKGIPMGLGTGIVTYLYARSRLMKMTWNASMTAGFAAGLTSSFIFSLTNYYNNLATMREVEDTLHPGWQERYGVQRPPPPPEVYEEWTLWKALGLQKKDNPEA